MHTHFYGRVVSTWRVRRNIDGTDEWMLLGKRHSVAEPQSFYAILAKNQDNIRKQNRNTTRSDAEAIKLVYGDTIAFR